MADDFLSTYAPLANDIATRTNIDPSVVLGIIDTETGHGVHVSGNNIFGISPSGPRGQYVAGYPDVQTASNAFINLMQTPRYAPVAAASDPASQAAALVKSGYNTANPNYASIVANKALSIGKQLGYQDDGQGGSGATVAVSSSQPAPDYSGRPAAPATPAPDYNTPAAAPPAPAAQPSTAKDRVAADPDLQPGGATAQPPAQGSTAKDRVAVDPDLQPGAGASTAPADLSQGYVGPDGSWVPPEAIPETKSSIPTAPPVTSLEDLRSRIQQGDIGAINALKPGPDAGPVERWLRQAAAVPTHLAAGLLQMPVNALIGLTQQGPAISDGALTVPGATWNPQTGTYGVTPEALAATQLLTMGGPAGRDLQFGPMGRPPTPGIIDTTRSPPLTGVNPLSSEAVARGAVREATNSVSPLVTPPGMPGLPPVPDGYVRLYHGGSDPTSGGARWVTPDYAYARNYRPGQPVSYVDVPKDNPAVQAAVASHPDEPMRVASFNAPEDIAAQLRPVAQSPPEMTALPSGFVQPPSTTTIAPTATSAVTGGTTAIPTTSEAAKAVSSAYYSTFDKAAQDGGSLTPQATNKFIASVEAAAPPPGIGQAVAGKNAITDLVERLQPYKDQPMSLQDAQVVDQQLGNLISGEYGRTGVSPIGRQLQGIQQDFRDQLSNPAAGDVAGGQAGLDALAPARKAYSQAMKMDTVERIQERADMTDNPTTSFRTQVRTLLSNARMSRGFSAEEKSALQDAAKRGAAGTALHIMGSRLIPIISGASGGGIVGSAIGATVGYGLNQAARAGENALAARRLQNAYTILGKSVPPNPLQPQ